MTWFIWIIISVVTTAAANVLQRVVMKEKDTDPFSTTIIFQFATALLTGIFALINGFVFPPIGQFFWNFILGAVLWGFMSYTSFLAFQTVESSSYAILSSVGTIVTILSAIIFLGESFTYQKTIGTLFIIISIILINRNGKKFTFDRGVWYVLLSTVFGGLAITNDAFILKTYDAVSYTSVMLLLPGLLLLLFRPRSIFGFKRLTNYIYSRNMFFLTIFYSTQAVAYYIALHIGANASQIAPISRSSIILTVLLGVIFLKERSNLSLKLASSVLVTIGVLLMR